MKRIVLSVFLILLLYGIVNANFPPEIPDGSKGLVYFPCNFYYITEQTYNNFWIALKDIFEAHGYRVAPWQMTRGRLPDEGCPPLEYLIGFLNDGSRGYFCIYTHGGVDELNIGWLSVEFFTEINVALLRLRELEGLFHAGDNIRIGSLDSPFGQLWTIDINAQFIQDNVNDLPHSLVFIDACRSADGNPSILSAFINGGAHAGFGWRDIVSGLEVQAPASIFYRMGGRNLNVPGLEPVIQNELFNKSAEQAWAEYIDPNGTFNNLFLMGHEDMRMYNSPRIVGAEIYLSDVLIYRYGFNEQGYLPTYPYEWDYPGNLSGCPRAPAEPGAEPLAVKVLFSSPINPSLADFVIESEQGTFSIEGNGLFVSAVLNNDLWVGSFDFSQWPVEEIAVLRVDAIDLFQGDINDQLDLDGDGDSDGTDRNHRFGVGAPRVISTNPQDEAENVDILTTITIDFDEPIDENTVNPQTILFSPSLLNSSFTTEWSGDWKSVNLTLTNYDLDFQYHTNYTVIITDEVRDRYGTRLDGDNDGFPGGNYELHFETRLPHGHLPYEGLVGKSMEPGESFTTYLTIANREFRTVTYQLFTLIEDPGGGWLLENLPLTQYVTLERYGEPNCSRTWWWTITRQGAHQNIRITFWPKYHGLDTDCGLEFNFWCNPPFDFPSVPVKPIDGVWCKDTNLVFSWQTMSFEKKDKPADSVIANSQGSIVHQSIAVLSDRRLPSDVLDSQVRYVIQVDTNSYFLTPLLTDTMAETQVTLNLGENRYFWRVMAYDLAGNQTDFSNPDSFGVDFASPTVPIPISISNDTIIQTEVIQPIWHQSNDNLSGVLNYQLQVSLKPDFTTLIKDTLLTDTSCSFQLPGSIYYWRVSAFDKAGNQSNWSLIRKLKLSGFSGVEDTKLQIPTIFVLNEPCPNPFRVSSEIIYTLPKVASVRLSVYNSSGKEIKVLDSKVHGTGFYKVQWNGEDDSGRILPAGIYFIYFKSDGFKVIKKLIKL
jgi:hypothetical protein